MLQEEVELQYSPSKWSKRFCSKDVEQQHFKFIEKSKLFLKFKIYTTYFGKKTSFNLYSVAKQNEEIQIQRNIKYGLGKYDVCDIYGPSIPNVIFVYIHGGYWQALNKDLSNYCVRPLIKQGVTVVVPDYELAPSVKIEQMIQQIYRLAFYVLKFAVNKNAKKVIFGGHSAGAHLASTLLWQQFVSHLTVQEKNTFSGVALISGIYDLVPLINTSYNKALKLTREEAEQSSPMKRTFDLLIPNNNFKILIAVAEHDSESFKEQTKLFKELLDSTGALIKYRIILNCDHFDVVENLNDEDYLLTKEILNDLLN